MTRIHLATCNRIQSICYADFNTDFGEGLQRRVSLALETEALFTDGMRDLSRGDCCLTQNGIVQKFING